MKLSLVLASMAALLLTPFQSSAETRRDVFTMSIRGITGGTVTLSANEQGNRYSVAGVITPSGLVKRVRNFSFRGSSYGTLARGKPRPAHYEEKADTGRRISDVLLKYRGGVPTVVRYSSPQPPAANTPAASTQRGTIDPLSAIFALLRDRPVAQGCATKMILFDGRRRSHIILGNMSAAADGSIRCTGEYRRLEGFTAEETSRHVYLPIQIVLDPVAGGMLRVREVSFESLYGTARLDRR